MAPQNGIPKRSLEERLRDGEPVLVAEGYAFEFVRRGYMKAGPYIPEIVLDHPELVRGLYEEFVHAGSDVVMAFTYYGHRSKLRAIGREEEVEQLNRTALKLGREVADKTGTLLAGNICNSTVYQPNDNGSHERVREMFKESVIWAVEEGADYIIGETFTDVGEAKLALEAIQQHGQGCPAVITFAQNRTASTRDGYQLWEACEMMEQLGAAVTGLNCSSGPQTMIPIMKEIRKVCKGPLAALPVAYRTTPEHPLMQTLVIPETGRYAFPQDLDYFNVTSLHIREFAEECQKLGIQYVGLCCGNSSNQFRRLAETFDRRPPASRYRAEISLLDMLGDYHFKLDGAHGPPGNVPGGM